MSTVVRPVRAAAAPVAVARCREYGPEIPSVLDRMFDRIGGLTRVVRGRTVAVKVNFGGPANERLGFRPHGISNWVHPDVLDAVIHLLDRAGAVRIRVLEGARYTAAPLEEHMLGAGWDPDVFVRAARRVELINTNVLGSARRYERVPVPGGGHLFRSFTLHPAYLDCDVFVSLAKLKEHVTAGVTLSMKNCFGITPTSIYGDDAGVDDANENPQRGRSTVLHTGHRAPARIAEPDHAGGLASDGETRIPRIVADVVAARPVHLSIIDGVESMAGGEGVRRAGVRPAHAGVLIAGTNCVNTDAVATAIMGFDPMALRGTAPFERCDSALALAENHGVGTPDLSRIEIAGASIGSVRYPFRNL